MALDGSQETMSEQALEHKPKESRLTSFPPQEGWDNLIEKIGPSVVSIISRKKEEKTIDLFDPKTGNIQEPQSRRVWAGSGCIIEGGYIITNAHVVQDPDAEYSVRFAGGELEIPVEAIWPNPQFIPDDMPRPVDFALIQLPAGSYQSVSVGDSRGIRRGQPVVAIGNSFGEFDGNTNTGIISSIPTRVLPFDSEASQAIKGLIKLNVDIPGGDSGGGLFNSVGELIGINVGAVEGRGESTGLSIPVDLLKTVIKYPGVFIESREIIKDALQEYFDEGDDESVPNLAAHRRGSIKGSFKKAIQDIVKSIEKQVPKQYWENAKKEIGADPSMMTYFRMILQSARYIRKPEMYKEIYTAAFGVPLAMSGITVAEKKEDEAPVVAEPEVIANIDKKAA